MKIPDEIIEEKILKLMFYDGRKSSKSIAEEINNQYKTKVTSQVIDVVIERMKKENKIFGFSTAINIEAMDMRQVMVWLDGQNDYYKIRNDLMKYGKFWEEICTICSVFGKNDFFIKFHTADISDIDTSIDNILFSVPNIKSVTNIASRVIRKYGFNIPENNHTIKIDNIDRKILTEIQRDCRISPNVLSTKIKIDEKEIYNRINKLEKEKIILGFHVSENYVKTGKVTSITHVNVLDRQYEDCLETLKSYFPSEIIPDIYSELGAEGTITLEIVSPTVKQLSDIIDEINSLPEVRGTESHIIAEYMHQNVVIPLLKEGALTIDKNKIIENNKKDYSLKSIAGRISDYYTPQRLYDTEHDYNVEFKMWLSQQYGQSNFIAEYGIGDSRLDFVIGNLAQSGLDFVGIELKVPKNKGDIQRVIGQIKEYKKKLDNRIILVIYPHLIKDKRWIDELETDIRKEGIIILKK